VLDDVTACAAWLGVARGPSLFATGTRHSHQAALERSSNIRSGIAYGPAFASTADPGVRQAHAREAASSSMSAKNPPNGAVVYYWLAEAPRSGGAHFRDGAGRKS